MIKCNRAGPLLLEVFRDITFCYPLSHNPFHPGAWSRISADGLKCHILNTTSLISQHIYKNPLCPHSPLTSHLLVQGDDDSIGEGPGTLIPHWLFESPTK